MSMYGGFDENSCQSSLPGGLLEQANDPIRVHRFLRNQHDAGSSFRHYHGSPHQRGQPDGTVRLTISNRADFPGGWIHKRESPRPDRRDAAGMLFMTDEGTEQGGLIWGAEQLPHGTSEKHGDLSLDQYEENQIFALDAGQEGKDKFSRISISDQGDYPVGKSGKLRSGSGPSGRKARRCLGRFFFASPARRATSADI
jgi:hypothetical protein